MACCSCWFVWAYAASRNADDACTDVFTASTDQSHCRQEIVIRVSTGLAIVLPPGKKNSPADEFIPSEQNTEEGRPIPASISRAAGPSAGFRTKPDDFVADALFRANAPCENRRKAINSKTTISRNIFLRGITGVQGWTLLLWESAAMALQSKSA